MAQRLDETPIRFPVEVVQNDQASLETTYSDRPLPVKGVPIRTQRMMFKQLIKQDFATTRAEAAIRNVVRVTDTANEEAATSMSYSLMIERGMGEDGTSEQFQQFLTQSRGVLLGATVGIQKNAAQELMRQADGEDLPDTAVSKWEVGWEWFTTH